MKEKFSLGLVVLVLFVGWLEDLLLIPVPIPSLDDLADFKCFFVESVGKFLGDITSVSFVCFAFSRYARSMFMRLRNMMWRVYCLESNFVIRVSKSV